MASCPTKYPNDTSSFLHAVEAATLVKVIEECTAHKVTVSHALHGLASGLDWIWRGATDSKLLDAPLYFNMVASDSVCLCDSHFFFSHEIAANMYTCGWGNDMSLELVSWAFGPGVH